MPGSSEIVEPSPRESGEKVAEGRMRGIAGEGSAIFHVSAAMLLLSLGESLWRKFLPQYLQALGAPIRAVGLFGSVEDFLDGIYQYPGGWLGDHLGRRRALLLFVVLALAGYAIYADATTWPWSIVALVFALGWSSMASPT